MLWMQFECMFRLNNYLWWPAYILCKSLFYFSQMRFSILPGDTNTLGVQETNGKISVTRFAWHAICNLLLRNSLAREVAAVCEGPWLLIFLLKRGILNLNNYIILYVNDIPFLDDSLLQCIFTDNILTWNVRNNKIISAGPCTGGPVLGLPRRIDWG